MRERERVELAICDVGKEEEIEGEAWRESREKRTGEGRAEWMVSILSDKKIVP